MSIEDHINTQKAMYQDKFQTFKELFKDYISVLTDRYVIEMYKSFVDYIKKTNHSEWNHYYINRQDHINSLQDKEKKVQRYIDNNFNINDSAYFWNDIEKIVWDRVLKYSDILVQKDFSHHAVFNDDGTVTQSFKDIIYRTYEIRVLENIYFYYNHNKLFRNRNNLDKLLINLDDFIQ
jgi:hypothetical protein